MAAHVAWIAVAVQLAATLAHAESAEARALAHLDRGVAAYRAGDFVRAHRELAEASRLAPDRPNPYRWLALTEVELGDCTHALVHVESFLARVPADDRRVAEVAALRRRCPTPKLTVRAGRELTPEEPGAAAVLRPVGERSTSITHAHVGPPVSPARPFYKRWWFWTLAGAAAVTGGVIGYELTRGSDARFPPVTCGLDGCRP